MVWSFSMMRDIRKKSIDLENKANSLIKILELGASHWCTWNTLQNTMTISSGLKEIWKTESSENIHVNDFIKRFDEAMHSALEDGLYQLRYNLIPLDLILQLASDDRMFRVIGKRDNDQTVILWIYNVTQEMNEKHQSNLKINNLLEERQRLRNILDTIPYPIWYRSHSGGLLFNNSAYHYALEGVSDQSDSGKQTLWLQMGVPEDSELSIFPTEHSTRKHCIIEGQRRLLEFHEENLNQDRVGYAIDLTAIETAERELRRYIDAHKEVLESLSVGITIYNADRRLVFYNHAYARMYEFDEVFLNAQPSVGELLENLRTRSLLQETSNFPEFKKKIYQNFTSLISSYQELVHLTDGRTIRIITSPHPLGGLFYIFENVTDALELERQYNTQIAVQKETLNSLHEGVAVFGRDMKLKLVNQEFLNVWLMDDQPFQEGITLSEALDIARQNIVLSESWEDFKGRILSLVSARHARSISLRFVDGRVLDCSYLPLLDGDHLFSIVDVTDRLLAEKALKERSETLKETVELKSKFLLSVSQLLSRPLQKIVGYSEILDSHYHGALNSAQKRYIKLIYSTSQNLSTVVEDLLDISNLDLHHNILSATDTDVESFIKSVLSPLKDLIKTTRISLKALFEKTSGVIVIDTSRMRRTLIRILAHVLHSLKSDDILRIHTKPKGSDSVNIRIVFPRRDEFFIILENENESPSSSQILPVLRKIVDMNGGSVHAAIKGENYCIDIDFPLKKKNQSRLMLPPQKDTSHVA